MSSMLTEEEIQEFRELLFPPNTDGGDASFNLSDLENAMRHFGLSVTDSNFKEIQDELEKETIDGEGFIKKVLRMAEDKIKAKQDLEEIKKTAIFSLGCLIDILGQTLKDEEMEHIISEGNSGGIDIRKTLSSLDKQVMDGDEVIDVSTLRRRIVCLGVIIRALGKDMTEDDLIDMLSEDNESHGQSGIVNYTKLLAMIEHNMGSLMAAEGVKQQENALKVEENGYRISLSEIRDVMSKLGSAMMILGQTCSDRDFELIMESKWDEEILELPKPIAELLENAFGCEYDFDIFNEFHKLDHQSSGYITTEELRKMLTNGKDPLTNTETDQILKITGAEENGMFKYDDFILEAEEGRK